MKRVQKRMKTTFIFKDISIHSIKFVNIPCLSTEFRV